jgi:hypothetical protein
MEDDPRWALENEPAWAEAYMLRMKVRKLWGLFFVCCLYSADVIQNCEGSLSRDTFLV